MTLSYKICNRCGERKQSDEFYKNVLTPDGRLNQCKVCTRKAQAVYKRTAAGKAVAKREREKHADKYREWKRAHKKTAKGRASELRSRRANYSYERNAAQMAVKWALQAGKIERLPCIICGDAESEAHHSSYAKDMRLCVTWLCRDHHGQLHREHARYEAQRAVQ